MAAKTSKPSGDEPKRSRGGPVGNKKAAGHGAPKGNQNGKGHGAPLGNKNAVTLGRYEAILLDTMDDEEREFYMLGIAREKLVLVNEQVAITSIRLRRMLKRMDEVRLAGVAAHGMTVVEETQEAIAADDGNPPDEKQATSFSDKWASELPIDDPRTQAAGAKPDQTPALLKVKTKRTATATQLQGMEADITAVQGHLARLIDLKHKLETQGGGEGAKSSLDELGRIIAESARALAGG